MPLLDKVRSAQCVPWLLVFTGLALVGCGRSPQSEPPPQSPMPPTSDEPVATNAKSATGLPLARPIAGTPALPSNPTPTSFTFVVFGDNRPAVGEPQPETIKEIFREIHQLQPAFALSLGDIIEGKPADRKPATTQRMREQFETFLGLASAAETPIFNAPGNHEMDDSEDIPTARMHRLYRELVGPTYGAFDYGKSRFLMLNTEDVPPPDAPAPPAGVEFSYLSNQQLAKLRADLDAHRDTTHIFIAMHYPIHAKDEGPPASDWDDRLAPASRKALQDILQDYDNIAYVYAAHGHLYYNPREPDNVTTVPSWQPGTPTLHLVSGGAGAPLNTGKWGFHHYLIFQVDGPRVTGKIVKLSGTGASS